jgi:hypothetical protein
VPLETVAVNVVDCPRSIVAGDAARLIDGVVVTVTSTSSPPLEYPLFCGEEESVA